MELDARETLREMLAQAGGSTLSLDPEAIVAGLALLAIADAIEKLASAVKWK